MNLKPYSDRAIAFKNIFWEKQLDETPPSVGRPWSIWYKINFKLMEIEILTHFKNNNSFGFFVII